MFNNQPTEEKIQAEAATNNRIWGFVVSNTLCVVIAYLLTGSDQLAPLIITVAHVALFFTLHIRDENAAIQRRSSRITKQD